MSIADQLSRPATRPVTRGITSRGGDAAILDIGFADQGGIPPGLIDFSRSSFRTVRRAGDGLMVAVPANAPAVDHDRNGDPLGLSIEGARTNLQLRSNELDDAAWNPVRLAGVVPGQATGPDGEVSLFALVEDASPATTHYLRDDHAGLSDNTIYCASYFVRAHSRTRCRLVARRKDSGTEHHVWFDLSSGTKGTQDPAFVDAGMDDWGSGLYRVWAAIDVLTGVEVPFFGLGLATADGTASYSGDGSSGLYAGFAQLEQGSFPSSYIETGATAVGRDPDAASIPLSRVAGFNSQAGTLAAEFRVPVLAGQDRSVAFIQAGAASNATDAVGFYVDPTTTDFWMSSSGLPQYRWSAGPAVSAGSSIRAALAYDLDNTVGAVNGAIDAVDTLSIPPVAPVTIYLGQGGAGFSLFGTIERLRYWPYRLSNDDLIGLTR